MNLHTFNCNKYPHFISFYEELLNTFQPDRILEIGVQTGRSLKMWAYSLPQAEIVGLDIEPPREDLKFPNIKMVIGSQTDTKLLGSLGCFDLIIDDGSHITSAQQTSFETLFPTLNAGGVYVIEDTDTSYEPRYVDTPLTTIEFLTQKLDTIPVSNRQVVRFVHEGIKSISFHQDFVVIKKI